MLYDNQARCLVTNRPGLDVMKSSNSELAGKEFREIWPEEYRPLVDDAVRRVMAGDSCEFEARRLNGPVMADWHIVLAPVGGNGSAVEQFVVIGHDITDRKQKEREREELIDKLKRANDEIKALRGIVPICSHCKKIRDHEGDWNQLEVYLDKHSEAQLTHSICPDCLGVSRQETTGRLCRTA